MLEENVTASKSWCIPFLNFCALLVCLLYFKFLLHVKHKKAVITCWDMQVCLRQMKANNNERRKQRHDQVRGYTVTVTAKMYIVTEIERIFGTMMIKGTGMGH